MDVAVSAILHVAESYEVTTSSNLRCRVLVSEIANRKITNPNP